MAIQVDGQDAGDGPAAEQRDERDDAPAGDRANLIVTAVRLVLLPFVGVFTGLLIWYLVARFVIGDSRLLASPLEVVQHLQDNWGFYYRNTRTTAIRSGQGLVIGVGLAVSTSILVAVFTEIERLSLRVATTVFAIPTIALAPVVSIIFEDQKFVAFAAFAVYFVVFIALMVGLRSVDATVTDLIRALGGGRLRLLRKARIQAAVPSFFAGVRVAVPAAVINVVIIETLGAESGLGVGIIGAMSALDSTLAWGVGVMASAITLFGYGLNALLAKLIAPRFSAAADTA